MRPDTVRLTRTIPAPPEEVYRAWTDPDRLRRWFGPDGFDVAEVELDLRPGGHHRTAVAGPDGLRGHFEGEYRELGWEEALGKPAADAGRPLPAKESLERLEALIGRWTTEGETVPGPSGPATKIAGTDTYERLGGECASMRASWERSDDDGRTWLPWMEIRLTRAAADG